MPLYGALVLCLRRVDITQRGAARVVSIFCHVRKLGPHRGFGQSPLRENKIVVLRVVIYDRNCLEHLTSACGGPPGFNKPRIQTEATSRSLV